MTTAIAKNDPRDISIGGMELTAVGIAGELAKPPSVEEFQASLAFIGRAAGASNWWIGDLANHADKWGDEYVQLLDSLGLEYNTLREYARVASEERGVSFAMRMANVSWAHHQVVAALTPKEQRYWLKKAQPKEGDTTPRLSVRELKQAIRAKRLEQYRRQCPLPEGKYRVLYADPPWFYNDKCEAGAVQAGGCERHYPSMSIAELCSLPVEELALDDSVLFMWVTTPLLEECFEVIAAWGFTYKTLFVWDKVKHNMGHYNSVRQELLLLCTRGSCTPDSNTLHDSVVSVERTTHSTKPDVFYEIIEEMYPTGTRVELFARASRPRWDAWGNELPAKPPPDSGDAQSAEEVAVA